MVGLEVCTCNSYNGVICNKKKEKVCCRIVLMFAKLLLVLQDPKHDTSIDFVDVQEYDLDVIDYDSFGSDLDGGIDSERRIQLRELRRIGKQKNKAIRENNNSGKQNILGKDKTVKGKDKKDHVIKSLATNPDIPVRAVQDQCAKTNLSYREQYSLLREYAQEFINQNPSITIRIDVQQEPNPKSLTRIFRRVYVCLGALKQGFRACGREILGLDGCFMSGPWPGQILTAVGVDANNGIYPVAYAIVEAESKASWCWFLNLLGEDLGIEANFNYTFISDRQKVCVRHIHENMKSQFKGGVYKEMLWNAAKATSKDSIRTIEQSPFLGRAKCDLLINNICEVFNRQLVDRRDQPIITCLEYIKEYLMKRIVDHYVVNMDRRVCSCTKWELTGIPCKHVVAAIYNTSENSVGVGIPEQWVHDAYRLETWAHVYSFKVNPCNGKDMWPIVESRTVIIPPLYKPLIGRPPKKKKKSNDEIASQSALSGKLSRKGKSDSCGKCGNVSGQAAGARNVSGQAGGVRKALSQRSAA
ncbi:mutator type transposase [Tanacetum coccineum]